MNEQKKEYDKKRYPKIKEQRKEYYLKNREYILKRQNEYNVRTWEHIKEYSRNKTKNDPNFRLTKNLRKRIWDALKGKNKSASTMELIGCTIEELWTHLESKFEPWMTRKNYGKGGWDVDHIEACSKFDQTYPEQQRKCFHWSNLQPMEHIANMKKGAR
jgi:hypothetical protein